MNEENFLSSDTFNVFSYGIPPICIEVLTELKGCEFNEAYKLSKLYEEEGLMIRFLHLNTLKDSKKAAGRYKDLDDLEKLSML
jgi:hypothetical protein